MLDPRQKLSQMFIITIIILITQQPEQDRLAENQPTASLSSLYENEKIGDWAINFTDAVISIITFAKNQ